MKVTLLRFAVVALCLLLFTACSSSGEGTPTPSPPPRQYPLEASISFAGNSGNDIALRAGTPGWLEISLQINDFMKLEAGDEIEIWESATVFYIAPPVGLSSDDFMVRVITNDNAQVESSISIPEAALIAELALPRRIGLITILSGQLLRGDRVSLLLSEVNNPGFRLLTVPIAIPEQEITFYLRRSGQEELEMIANPIRVTIMAGKPSYLKLVLPGIVEEGEPFSMLARVDDRHGNLVKSYDGAIDIPTAKISGLPVSYIFTEDDQGNHHFDNLVASSAGTYRITAHDSYYDLQATSNPVEVIPSPPAERIYWGDLHCHAYDGHELSLLNEIWDPREIYRRTREEQGLDFIAVTPHLFTHSPDLPATWWPLVREGAEMYYEPGRFVTFLGYEWRGQGGDHNVIYPGDMQEILTPDNSDINLMYDQAAAAGALVIPHVGGATADLSYHDDRVQRAVEVTSLHRHSEWFGHESLSFGNKTGFIGSSDDHSGNCGGRKPIFPGTKSFPPDLSFGNAHNHGGLTAVYSPSLTREDVHQAIFDRRTYATTGARIILHVDIDGNPMGAEFSTFTPPTINVSVSGTADIDVVEIIRNDETLYEEQGNGTDMTFSYTDFKAPVGECYYYVRVTQLDDEIAWSSPIWVDFNGAPPLPGILPAWNYERLEFASPEDIIEAELYRDIVTTVLEDIGADRLITFLTPHKVVRSPEGSYVVFKTFDSVMFKFIRVEYFIDRVYRALRMWPGSLHYGQYQ